MVHARERFELTNFIELLTAENNKNSANNDAFR